MRVSGELLTEIMPLLTGSAPFIDCSQLDGFVVFKVIHPETFREEEGNHIIMRLLLPVLLCAALLAELSTGYHLPPPTRSFASRALLLSAGRGRRAKTTPLFGSREEEISRLEEQLRKLRKEEEEKTPEKGADETLTAGKEEKISSQRLEATSRSKDMMLSEGDLIGAGIVEDAGGGGVGGLGGVVAAVVGLVLLIAFSQVPIGQESVSQYSATGSSADRTIDLGDLNPDAPPRP